MFTEYLPKFFQLSEEYLVENKIVVNRIGWARTYLKSAGLITSPKRAVFRITERGKSILNNPYGQPFEINQMHAQ